MVSGTNWEWNPDEYSFIGQVMSWAYNLETLDRETVETLGAIRRHSDIPRDYLVLDVETLGFSPRAPIIQVGWGVVSDAELVNVESILLNWSDPAYGQRPSHLREQINRITRQMAENGKRYCTTYERMVAEGDDPYTVMESFKALIDMYLADGQMVVGHNAWKFDRMRIDFHCQEFFNALPNWQPNSIFDTGLIEKAAQMNRPPHSGETLDAWYTRVYGGHSRIKWSLEGHCAEKYRLAERYGVDPTLAHDAGHDCRMTYCLFETYRHITEILLGYKAS